MIIYMNKKVNIHRNDRQNSLLIDCSLKCWPKSAQPAGGADFAFGLVSSLVRSLVVDNVY